MKFTLFLMTYKGLEVINSIIENSNISYVEKVIIGTDHDVVDDFSENIKLICIQHKIPYNFKEDTYFIKTEYAIAVSWRWLIKEIDFKLIVLHDSLLPKYRGFAPLVNMLINGEKKIGVTALFASKDYDKGEIISQKDITIEYPIKISSAIEKIGSIYKEIVQDIFYKVKNDIKFKSNLQDEDKASYSLWRDKDDYFINWNHSAKKIRRFVDALGFPYDGAKAIVEGEIIVVSEVEVYKNSNIINRDVGKIIFFDDGYPIVVCAKGLIKITEASYKVTGKSVFPLKKFRIRFT